MSNEILEREDLDIVSGIEDTEVENLVDKLANLDIDSIENSDEERMEMIDNADISKLKPSMEINQGTGLFREDDPNGVQPLNDLNDINDPKIGLEEVVYKDLNRPVIDKTVNVDNMTNEERYGDPTYGKPVSSGISGDITGRVETVDSEKDNEYGDIDDSEHTDDSIEEVEDVNEEDLEKEDENVGKIADEINRAFAKESEDGEELEIPEELNEDKEVEEAEDTEGEDTTPEPVEEENTEDIEEDIKEEDIEEEYKEEEEIETEYHEEDEEMGEDLETPEDGVIPEEETVVVEVENLYSGDVSEELEGELKKEVEAIELGDNSNTKMFDDVSFMKDAEHEVNIGSDLEAAKDMASEIVDGVGVQETYEGEDIARTGTEETVTETADTIPGADEAEAEERIEEKMATESLREYDLNTKFSTKSVLKGFWGK